MLREFRKDVSFSRARIDAVRSLDISADELVGALLSINANKCVCFLDSCGVGHLGSHLLIAGVLPVEVFEITDADPEVTMRLVDEKLSGDLAGIFTLSYGFGAKLQRISSRRETSGVQEPDLFLALFDVLIIHDYDLSTTTLAGDERRFAAVEDMLAEARLSPRSGELEASGTSRAVASVERADYIRTVELIREYIRRGDTYQTNLTQQIRCALPSVITPESIWRKLRRDHPAPFSAFLRRRSSTVISASPERFFRIDRNRGIDASPIKGTRRRGIMPDEDARLRMELATSAKDRAENTMIVDLVRNDLGRVCEFGTVRVEKLCYIEEHPTLFHLVSTVRGDLRSDVSFSDILRATFPCGSITGAPKIRTMQIIDEIESVDRGLSMGAIGVYLPPKWRLGSANIDTVFDLSVAIRTMVIRGDEAVFNVGGGVVIDSEPDKEYEESLLKAQALLRAIGAELPQ